MLAIIGAILFVLLTPGLILRIPPKGSLLTASIVHAVVFGIVFYLVAKITYQHYNTESFGEVYPKFEVINDNHGCKKNHCNNTIKNNDRISVSWWNEGQGCHGCSFVKDDENDGKCNVDHCNKSILNHLKDNYAETVPDSWWEKKNGCSGCTTLKDI